MVLSFPPPVFIPSSFYGDSLGWRQPLVQLVPPVNLSWISVIKFFPLNTLVYGKVVCKGSLIKKEKLWTLDAILSFLFVLSCLNIPAGLLYFGVKTSNGIPKTHVPSSTSLRLAWQRQPVRAEVTGIVGSAWKVKQWILQMSRLKEHGSLPQGMLRKKAWLLSFCKSSVFSYDPCRCLYNKWIFPHVLQLWCRHNILNPHSKFQRPCNIPSITCASPVLFLLFLQFCTFKWYFWQSAWLREVPGISEITCIKKKHKQEKQKTQG